eukprot:TRINITY_DN24733_c0_g1_i1.p1 TRINITY_DN24733_c0_g1~~TRINITY_DN24733_c0_g1_i1.p1  ORF type:complete len:629 (-),score=193.20 TRINITY_DN24733_c0_g1_i1:23-1909(-)
MTSVEGTNDYSIVSKLSAASAGYFKDDFLVEFVEKQRRRASLVNWGYYLRFKSLEATFEKFVKHLCDKKDEKFQILSVGAGFDTTFFNVSQYGNNFKFFEVDLPSNVKRKTCLIENSEKCCKVLQNPKFSSDGIVSENFTLFACDLANQVEFKQKLSNLGFDFQLPTVILSECVITYMDEKDSTNLIKFLGSNLKHAAFCVYEQIRPHDGFGQFMVAHFVKMLSPIKGVLLYPSTSAQRARYLSSGWERCYTLTLTEVYNSLPAQEKQRLLGIEPFDEFEEFLLASSHYLVVCSTIGDCCHLLDRLTSSADEEKLFPVSTLTVEVVNLDNIARFGQGVACFHGSVYVIGGFGVDNGNQRRLPQLLRVDLAAPDPAVTCTTAPVFGRMYPGVAVDQERGRVVVSGGRLGPAVGLEDILEIDCKTECGDGEVLAWSLPGGRWRHCSVIVGDYLVIVGGCGVEGARDDVLALDMRTGQWLEPVLLGESVFSGSGVVWGAKVIFSGGWSPDGVLGGVKTIVIKDNKIIVKDLDVKITPRFSHTSHVINDQLVVVGGVGLSDIPPVEVFKLITGEVTRNELPASVGGELLMIHNHGSVVFGEHMYFVGGGGNCFSFGNHYNKTFRINLSQLLS